MKLGGIIKTTFVLGFVTALVAGWLKITHSAGAEPFLYVCIISTILYIAFAIFEIRTSPKISNSEKTIWTLAFIFFSGITALIYFLAGRNRIAAES